MLALLLAVAVGPATAAPLTDAHLVAALNEARRHARQPPAMPDARQRAALLEGRTVRMRLPSAEGEPVGVLALAISDLSKEELWIGSADSDMGEPPEEVISHHLPLQGGEMFRWYGYIHLPAPITDRHFLVRTTVDPGLARATGGRMWARSWEIEPGGLATARAVVAREEVPGVDLPRFDGAIWLPQSTGAWLVMDLPDGRALFSYQATASLGGNVPDGLVTRTAYWGLGRLMDEVMDQARQARAHYRAGHAPIEGGDGQPVPRFE